MNPCLTPFLQACVRTLGFVLFVGVCRLAAETEFIPSANPLPTARVEFSSLEGRPGIAMSITSPVDLTEPFSPSVTVSKPDGTLLPVASDGDGRFVVDAPDATALRVTVAPDAASAGKVRTLNVAVFCGDLGAAMRRLHERARALPPIQAKAGLAHAIERDMRAWILNRLAGIESEPVENPAGPASGNPANEYLYASELIGWMEKGSDIFTLARGRQLPARHTFEVKDGAEDRTMAFNFMIRLPETASEAPWPLLVVIHGFSPKPTISGAVREEIESVAGGAAFPFLVVSLSFNGPMRGSGGWNPAEVTALIDSLHADYPADRDRTYLTGFSMGGMGTIRVVAHRPDMFAAYAPLCPRADPSLAPKLADVPAYFYHGENDPTISVEQSVVFCKALEAAGGKPRLRIYQGMGHAVWTDVYREPAFYEKLLSHRRSPAPVVHE
ncbi:MAG TPA: dienelactone hydrolase family protein [Opitutaceae bacterium]|nr:dienelactone hydrolase family protein [Opitutaceae bacterium]